MNIDTLHEAVDHGTSMTLIIREGDDVTLEVTLRGESFRRFREQLKALDGPRVNGHAVWCQASTCDGPCICAT